MVSSFDFDSFKSRVANVSARARIDSLLKSANACGAVVETSRASHGVSGVGALNTSSIGSRTPRNFSV
jgi:hypothetical protein